jgi:hypothetical protein
MWQAQPVTKTEAQCESEVKEYPPAVDTPSSTTGPRHRGPERAEGEVMLSLARVFTAPTRVRAEESRARDRLKSVEICGGQHGCSSAGFFKVEWRVVVGIRPR